MTPLFWGGNLKYIHKQQCIYYDKETIFRAFQGFLGNELVVVGFF